jgi:hypothetical protein
VKACNLADFNGSTTATGWLQLHDTNVAPMVNAVPIAEYQIPIAGPFPLITQVLGPILFTIGLVIAMSTTQGKYVAAAGTFDFEGDIEEWEYARVGMQVVGDLTTPVTTLTVWSDSINPSGFILSRLQVTELLGVASYLMLFATSPTIHSISPYPIIPIAASATVDLFFNINPLQGNMPSTSKVSGNNGNQVIGRGCIIAVSTDPTMFSNTGSATIRAEYKHSLTV